MTTLHSDQRKLLEKAVENGRDAAEKAADAALRTLAVPAEDPFAGMSVEDRQLRRLLRADIKRLGSYGALVAEIAYAQWHRMLFARFLAENDLLMHPTGVPMTLAECGEMADTEGEPDEWMVAAKYAALMLPGIFPTDDPLLSVRFDAFGRQALEALIAGLPATVFQADDALGWVYQFWQTKRKAEVNAAGNRIGGADISPVTQLFTEPYMVQFLLHNSLGAWWAARHPESRLNATLTYLRRGDDGVPDAGTFSGWPKSAAELRVMDPCCGSGHFLQAAFDLLRQMRMEEEGLSEAEAGDAVLRDNLHGLELDPRCTQIATFAVALAAWKTGGYRPLPLPHIACSGLAVGGELKEWTRLAEPGSNLQTVMFQMFSWFKNAPDLGSLIDPSNAGKYKVLEPWDLVLAKLTQGLDRFQGQDDPAAKVFGDTARGTARAAELLFARYHLVCTNVPFLGRSNQDKTLYDYSEEHYPNSKADLATVFVDRCLSFCEAGGSCSLVTPQNWRSLGRYEHMRRQMLRDRSWNVVAVLGPRAFETISGEVVSVALFTLTNTPPQPNAEIVGWDVTSASTPTSKSDLLRTLDPVRFSQSNQLQNPDARIILEEMEQTALLSSKAFSWQGIKTSDDPRFVKYFWEHPTILLGWKYYQRGAQVTTFYGGKDSVLFWENGYGELTKVCQKGASFRGKSAWGKRGVAVNTVGGFACCIYEGNLFASEVAIIEPKNHHLLPAFWAFTTSAQFRSSVRQLDRKVAVTNSTLGKVPFDLDYWQGIAAAQFPDGLPEPKSDDPTQWLFHGHPSHSTHPLQVATARLLGYHWPEHGLPPTPDARTRQESDSLDIHADADGIVCLPSVDGEAPAAERLRALIADAYGADYTPGMLEGLLGDAGFGGGTLDAWLRDGFALDHNKRFGNRPFLWQIWDGRKDGFSAIVNYHGLDRQKLEKLTFRYLGDWIKVQRDADARGEAGANARLVAALTLQGKLQAILSGDPPYDIYVRWKPLSKQPIGWDPDLNDGVRMNIRPFYTAGVLKASPNVNWRPDRGKNPEGHPGGPERVNALHYTRAEKEANRIRPG